MHQATWASGFGTVSVGFTKVGVVSPGFDKCGMYLQQRLWTPLIFLGASAAGRPTVGIYNINKPPSNR